MVFSSTIFLFLFLPCVLALYALSPRRIGNHVLLAASLLFYAWGERFYVGVMVLSILLNYRFGHWIERSRGGPAGRRSLAVSIAVNLGLLWFFKYTNFLVANVNQVLEWSGSAPLDVPPVHLPLGISFFTLHALSFLMDVYRGDARAPRSLVDLALYIALFPQLIAGPIVRYREIDHQLRDRHSRVDDFAEGVRRFVLGLGKKALIANQLDPATSSIFALPPTELSPGLAWFGLIAYTLQVYFDFSGYSDMAIGLARMLGFRFPENFRFPFISRSIREVWTRWHISLGTWFRDYLYVPLGGNRAESWKVYRNLLVVFVLCGLWHGANWTFVLFGLYHGFFLILERQRALAPLGRVPVPLRHLYCLFFWTLGIVLFRAPDIVVAGHFYRALFGFGPWQGGWHTVALYLENETLLALAAAVVCSMPLHASIARWYRARVASLHGLTRAFAGAFGGTFTVAGLMVLFWLSALYLSATTHNPFIYFQF